MKMMRVEGKSLKRQRWEMMVLSDLSSHMKNMQNGGYILRR